MKLELKKFDELTTRELYEILKLRIEIFSVEQNCVYQDLDDLDYEANHFMIKHEGKIVAYLRILNKGVSFEEAVSFGRVVVDKNYRGFGLAKELILETIYFVENELKENIIIIKAMEYVQNMYALYGFKVISDVYDLQGFPHVNMMYEKH